ncbi:Probable transmembrane protein of unknown function [Flavobacterium indicum GPTSA100-9 = DSM 17447]|uniref:Peptidase C39 domain-containing protein n=1 Tax=Flavobacterium indicum (strain DSM 17447 / CIP 109464 / GPTSA100-9) TaxID=1094466 RepID=H8XNT1_FLAIG|nr:vitamin K epoxide reductase family protein [Flavobacterium indicum]CCG52198.1 Probable transmembrane protein of unknown function [Flavobacterium indicum GPTSA100-9 = DSM 17447]
MLNTIIAYLHRLGFNHKLNEFKNNYYSHPNYPSLLAITDSLNLVGIENVAANVPFNNINNLPNKFVAELVVNNKNDFFIIEKVDDEFFISNENFKRKQYSFQSLTVFWTGLILLVEENESPTTKENDSRYSNFILLAIIGLCLVLLKNNSFYTIVQLILSLTGLFLSLEINKSFFSGSKDIESKFCNYGNDFSCNDIIKSNTEIFKKHLSFVDLPILFFSFSFLLQVFFPNLIEIIGLLSLLSSPVILYSIYYQKFKAKKWCVLCLSVSFVIILNSILFLLNFNSPKVDFVDVFNVFFLMLIVYMFWKVIKKNILKNNDLQNQNNALLRFKRDKEIFEKLSKNVELNSANLNLIELGNENARNTIILFISPSCPHCHKAFKESIEIIEKFPEAYNLKIGFNVNVNNNENPFIDVVFIILRLHSSNGDYKNALIDWHIRNMEIEKWKEKWEMTVISTKNEIEEIKNQFNWCLQNDFHYAPVRVFNGFLLNENYDLKDVFYFVDD